MTDRPGVEPAQAPEFRERGLDAPSGLFPKIGHLEPGPRRESFLGPADRSALAAAAIGLISTALALAGLCFLGSRVVAIVGGIVAIVLGVVAQRRIGASAGRLVGTPQAAVGIGSGSVAIFLGVLTSFVFFLN
jgi:hypothetical protein